MRHDLPDQTFRQRACPWAMGGSGNRGRGFSVIDLLVSIAVMALLITILLPSLTSANEMARRAKCASNIRQLGLGVQMYAYDHSDLVPQSRFNTLTSDGRGTESAETIFLRIDGEDWRNPSGDRLFRGVSWDGLGVLALNSYADAPHVYYCPSHQGEHPYAKYKDVWTEPTGSIAGNYQYRIFKGNARLGNLKPALALIADGMKTPDDYNHKVGNNMLKADLSVTWFSDHGGELIEMLRNAGGSVDDAWHLLDRPIEERPSGN